MIGETGLGVFTGAITSAGTFYAMCISEFRGLRDLGFLIGSGILLCAVAIVFMLPAMIKWNEGVRKRKVDSVKKLHLQSFLLEHLIPFSARHRRLVIAVDRGADRWRAPAWPSRLELRRHGQRAAQQPLRGLPGAAGDRGQVRRVAVLHDGHRRGARPWRRRSS